MRKSLSFKLLRTVSDQRSHLGRHRCIAWDGAPQAIRTVKLWETHGGLFTGPHQYYLHLLEQRKILPFDWDRVIDIQNLPLAADSTGIETGEVAVAIIREGVTERLAARWRPKACECFYFHGVKPSARALPP